MAQLTLALMRGVLKNADIRNYQKHLAAKYPREKSSSIPMSFWTVCSTGNLDGEASAAAWAAVERCCAFYPATSNSQPNPGRSEGRM
jgi:hypothetical protein